MGEKSLQSRLELEAVTIETNLYQDQAMLGLKIGSYSRGGKGFILLVPSSLSQSSSTALHGINHPTDAKIIIDKRNRHLDTS